MFLNAFAIRLGVFTVALTGYLTSGSAIAQAAAQLRVLVAIDRSAGAGQIVSPRLATSTLQAAVARPVLLNTSSDYANVLRSTRTGEYDIYIGPAHVTASAMNHGYQLMTSSPAQEAFVLVTKPSIKTAAELIGKKIYLPHQDSLYSYMAKGLINENGGSLSQASKVDYQRTAGAGLLALQLGMVDATVVRKSEFATWEKTAKGAGIALVESQPVPIGMSITVHKNVPESVRQKIAAWAAKDANMSQSGFGTQKPTKQNTDANSYKYLAGLAHFTPTALPNVQRIDAQTAANLMKQGAVLVDVRSDKEFNTKRIPGAVLAPYIEKSLKETGFNAALDDFSAVDKFDKTKPAIFSCNGPECWKSYKASQVAVTKGFQKVYWLRGGLPEWEGLGMPLTKE